jgi:lambda family phage portal protein
MADQVSIIDAQGRPMRPSRASALAGGGNIPHDAADIYGSHSAEWSPYLSSPDAALNMYRDRIVARIRDLVRNDGWASGAITRVLDNAIGANFRPIAKPDYRALAAISGNKAFDAKWAEEYGRAVDARYRLWAEDEGRYCDAHRQLTVPQMLRLGFRHKIVDGDALFQVMWLPQRRGFGKARYCTAVQVVDPDRLSNPNQNFDLSRMRGGVELDEIGAPSWYHIRQAHQSDWFSAEKVVRWDRIPRETPWGRPIIVHDFDHEQAGQHRGLGILGPVVLRLKALIKYDGVELDAAILNAIFASYIESPHDPAMVESALGEESIGPYQGLRADYHEQKRLSMNGARIPILFPGEKINTVTAARPNSNFDAFEKAMLRNVASASGLSAQQVSQDWSDVNYSSARAALLEAYKTMDRRRRDYAVGTASPLRAAWLEESHDVDALPLPRNAPEFAEARGAYGRAMWLGPGRGWIDPVAEREGAVLGMEAALSTLELEAADQDLDYEEVLDQRQREAEAFKSRGLEPPASWLANRDPNGRPLGGGGQPRQDNKSAV